MVRRSEFLSWVTFYKAVLGFVDEPQVELADPYGAFYSRCSLPRRKRTHPVNIADGGATAVSRFIEAFGGGGVQQIAFATKDLLSFVEGAGGGRAVPHDPGQLLRGPVGPLRSCARTAGSDPRPRRPVRPHRGGEFFHIYTRLFDDRFFFEVLERRNYNLFGAANTPVRLAAQAAEMDQSVKARAEFGI